MLSFYKYGLDCSVEKIQFAGDDLHLPNGPNGQRVYYNRLAIFEYYT